jgi:glyoxylase-like metal-dependent hydrolase (beta-lactamase superfamily II)
LAEGSVIIQPTRVFDTTMEIDLGGRVLRLTAHRPAHTDNDVSVFDQETGTLWAGDLIFMDRVPALDGSLLGWLAALAELRRTPAVRVVPGHGPVSARWPDALAAEERYLALLRDQIRRVLRQGGTIERAVATAGQEERDRWQLFDDYNARNVTTAFHELEWE